MVEVAIPFIHSLIVVDADGDRLLAKYYDGKDKIDQLKFESTLSKKTKALSSKSEVLDTIFDTVATLLKGTVEKRAMLDSLELVLLTIDESIDHGYIMELDSTAIVSRVLMKSSESAASPQPSSLGDLTISQALGLAREQFMKSLGGSRATDGY